MIRLATAEREALHALQSALDDGDDTIDDVLKLSAAGFGTRPFAELDAVYPDPLAAWQAEELSDHLTDLLDTVDAWLEEGARAHLDPAIPARLGPLIARLRGLEHRLADATDA